MKEQYIKQVEKELSLPHKAKKEVVRDLNEVFRVCFGAWRNGTAGYPAFRNTKRICRQHRRAVWY